MSVLLMGLFLSTVLTLGAVALASRDDPDGFSGT
jgi:hypothetical protein